MLLPINFQARVGTLARSAVTGARLHNFQLINFQARVGAVPIFPVRCTFSSVQSMNLYPLCLCKLLSDTQVDSVSNLMQRLPNNVQVFT